MACYTEETQRYRHFPGSPVVKTSPSSAGGVGSIPGQGTKIPHASRPKHQTEANCNKFNKEFKNGPHQKKKSLKNKTKQMVLGQLNSPSQKNKVGPLAHSIYKN